MVNVLVEISGMDDFNKFSRCFFVRSGSFWDINLYVIFHKSTRFMYISTWSDTLRRSTKLGTNYIRSKTHVIAKVSIVSTQSDMKKLHTLCHAHQPMSVHFSKNLSSKAVNHASIRVLAITSSRVT